MRQAHKLVDRYASALSAVYGRLVDRLMATTTRRTCFFLDEQLETLESLDGRISALVSRTSIDVAVDNVRDLSTELADVNAEITAVSLVILGDLAKLQL